VLLIITHGLMNSAVSEAMKSCGPQTTPEFCGPAAGTAMSLLNVGLLLKVLLMALPVLGAMFVAAPLVAREVEQGTHTFIWTQSITRMHWFAVKVLIIVMTGATVAAAVAAAGGWWQQPFDLMTSNGPWSFFDVFGPVPVAYLAFAVALGLAASVYVRRTVPAMAATLLAFVVVRVVAALFLRPQLQPPVVRDVSAVQDAFPVGSLQMDFYWVDPSNHKIDAAQVNRMIEQNFPGSVGPASPSGATPIQQSAELMQWLHGHGYHLIAVYQPADRVLAFQAIEAGLFVLLAALLLAPTVWWLRHRLH
jgi:hypothetical protein